MTIRSLFVGLTGLTAMGQGIDVISNNIANINTVGFRAGRASFDDLFYRTISAGVGSTATRGGINPQQLGSGVKLGSIDTIFTQCSSQSTGRLLDMSIEISPVPSTCAKSLTRLRSLFAILGVPLERLASSSVAFPLISTCSISADLFITFCRSSVL